MADTNEQLRAKVDQAMIYAPAKWTSHVMCVAKAYAAAYANQALVLKNIEASKRAEAEFASMLASIILPSVVGGFVGAIISGQGRSVIDTLTSQAAKYNWGVAIDTAKTVASDLYKADVRMAYQRLLESSGWQPTSISPNEFTISVQSSISDFVTAAADAMNDSKKGRTRVSYRDVLTALYYSNFIREAPEVKDLWSVDELSPVLEIFLWVDWANHRDTKYWLERIMRVTDGDSSNQMKLVANAREIQGLNPILERLDQCGVDRAYDTQGMAALDGSRFLNILWLRKLGPRYADTLLGDLLQRLDNSQVPVPNYRRPGSYRLM